MVVRRSDARKEGAVAKRARAYKGEKRSKELARQKKQEEKRLRRLHRGVEDAPAAEEIASEEKIEEQQE